MFVEEYDIWEKSGKTNGSAETGKAAANDEKGDLHKIRRLLAVAQGIQRSCQGLPDVGNPLPVSGVDVFF